MKIERRVIIKVLPRKGANHSFKLAENVEDLGRFRRMSVSGASAKEKRLNLKVPVDKKLFKTEFED